MSFQKRTIKKNKWNKAERWIKGHIVLSIILIVVGAFVLKGAYGAFQAGTPLSVKQIVLSAVSQDIKADRYGHTNILLLGVGGEGHDGENLTDTMIVASIDHKQKLIPMVSIPRDLFVEPVELGYGTRINGIYELILEKTEDPEFAMEVLTEEIEGILDVDIHYYAKVDFNGFVDIVDAVGGIEVTLEEGIYDPYYPAPPGWDSDYQIFQLGAGTQMLDGEDALKYVRSRKTTSDFDRARRQQEVISAIKDEALKIGLLLNPSKLKNLYSAVSNNFETDLTWTELLDLASIADQFGTESVISQVISDQANVTGGFLYTPERELYGGAFVLIPYAGDYSEIHAFANLLLYNPQMYLEDTPIHVMNGTKEEGLAATIKMHLVRYGFKVVRFGNAANENVEETIIFSNQELTKIGEETLQLIPTLIPGKILGNTPPEYTLENFDTNSRILIELGADFLDFYYENDERFYIGFF